jgi:anti-sigma B factor antagonist
MSLLQCGRYCVVALAGELDAYTSCALRERLAAIGAEGSSARVVLDLAAVSFVASAGLGTLVWATKRLRARGGDVVIKAPNAQVARLLEITGLRHILTIDEGAPALPSGIGGCVVVSGDDSPIALSARSMTQGAHHGLERSDI